MRILCGLILMLVTGCSSVPVSASPETGPPSPWDLDTYTEQILFEELHWQQLLIAAQKWRLWGCIEWDAFQALPADERRRWLRESCDTALIPDSVWSGDPNRGMTGFVDHVRAFQEARDGAREYEAISAVARAAIDRLMRDRPDGYQHEVREHIKRLNASNVLNQVLQMGYQRIWTQRMIMSAEKALIYREIIDAIEP